MLIIGLQQESAEIGVFLISHFYKYKLVSSTRVYIAVNILNNKLRSFSFEELLKQIPKSQMSTVTNAMAKLLLNYFNCRRYTTLKSETYQELSGY